MNGQIAAAAGLVGFLWLGLFQLLLAAGAPLGRMAWGGADRVLPMPRRLASLAVVPLAGLGAWQMAVALGVMEGPVLRWLLWALAGLFALSFVGNALSSSRVERLHGVPLTVLLALSCLGVAVG